MSAESSSAIPAPDDVESQAAWADSATSDLPCVFLTEDGRRVTPEHQTYTPNAPAYGEAGTG